MGLDLDTAVVAIDGGGTRCRFALEAAEGRWVVVLGPANVTTDFDRAIATIRDGLGRLAAEVSIASETLAGLPAYVGLAGIVDEDDGRRVLGSIPLRNATVEDDRRPAVRGALGEADGALAGLGTGSFFARQAGGRIRLAGGWGARLGDEASGFWIAREALTATLATVDGLLAPTALSRLLLDRCGGRPRGIVAFGMTASTEEVAALAPLVAEAAEGGDEIGRRVLSAAARHVHGTLRAMGWHAGEPLCLIGGVSASLRGYLPPEAGDALVAARGSALDGALDLARDTGRKRIP